MLAGVADPLLALASQYHSVPLSRNLCRRLMAMRAQPSPRRRFAYDTVSTRPEVQCNVYTHVFSRSVPSTFISPCPCRLDRARTFYNVICFTRFLRSGAKATFCPAISIYTEQRILRCKKRLRSKIFFTVKRLSFTSCICTPGANAMRYNSSGVVQGVILFTEKCPRRLVYRRRAASLSPFMRIFSKKRLS